ncbi:MAG: phosphate acyltransferase PlsX [Gammaproteobacteria bacterium]|nr:phosphate acyltransferase PlsX [Gammaproteobacteria bacterium]MBT8110999.1 phosphate acyltransferase PlsX [Gammaproteobacteria bacterium]NND48435.1 phosphate acyltransferase PlsX [Woeseiaceae bacterium]NNL45697.1 phosphate acyltransferase PlsX [Woeseiaceae bacterium]
MSGDLGAEIVVRAAAATLQKYANLDLILVGDEVELRDLVTRIVGQGPRLRIQHASEVVAMSEPPADALRKKKDSSMRVAINLVKSGDADACVSAGNTGALMATARFVLKMLPGIDRPAIITELPAKGGSLHMLDLGANTQGSAEHLFQYAVMGSIVASDISRLEKPKIALLNIGAEDTKGDDTVKDAAAMLSASTLNYVGFIEGSDLFSGKADVVVTDGFTGNVALKTMEGTVGLCVHYLKRAFTRGWLAKFQALLARQVLKRLATEMDPRNYNGATLVGLNGIVIKSHGSADAYAYQHAIDTAVVEVRNQLPQQIGRLLQEEMA